MPRRFGQFIRAAGRKRSLVRRKPASDVDHQRDSIVCLARAPAESPAGGTLRGVDERQFFTERPEQRPASFQCPRCRRTNEYAVRWLRRTKKAQPPSGADQRARAMFDKVKDHLVRVDDDVTCKTCGKRFEIPSHRGLVFLEELEGLPKDEYDE